MRKSTWLFAALCLAATASRAVADEPEQTYELRAGQVWERVMTSAPTEHMPHDATLDQAQALLEKRENAAAKKLLVPWFQAHPGRNGSPLRDRALFMLGEANYRLDERIQSFYDFDELMDLYPESHYFQAALRRQYNVADAFLNGHKRRFLGMRIVGATEEAIEMLYRIQQRSPGSAIAEKCLLRTADFYYSQADYDLAVDAYASFIRSYPRSPDAPEAKVRQAFSDLAQFRGVLFDASPLLDARQLLTEVSEDYPEMARRQNLASVIERIDGLLARKVYARAEFYVRVHQPEAAAYSYRYLATTWPNLPEADMARRKLALLPAAALVGPPPATQGALP